MNDTTRANLARFATVRLVSHAVSIRSQSDLPPA